MINSKNADRRFTIVLLIVALAGFVCADDGVKVHTELGAKSFYLGQPFDYTILIDGDEVVDAPELIDAPGFYVKHVENQLVSSEGKKGYSVRYSLSPRVPGQSTIPKIDIKVGGASISTKPVEITVEKPAENPSLKMEVHLSQHSCYVGEPVIATFRWYSSLPLNGFRAVDVDSQIFHLPSVKVFDLPVPANDSGKKAIGLPVANSRIIAKREEANIDGKPFEVLSFQKIIMPTEAGTLTIPPATLLCSFVMPFQQQPGNQGRGKRRSPRWQPQYPSFFNNNFFEDADNEKFKRYYAKSEPLVLEVMPLPTAGQPEDFSGIVGVCSIDAKAVPTNCRVGDPVTLTITLARHPFPNTLRQPDLAAQKAFSASFAILENASIGQASEKQAVFVQTLRPLRADVALIPGIRVPYFDPQAKRYDVATSQPIPIIVNPAEVVTVFDAALSDGDVLKNPVIPSQDGIRHNVISEDAALTPSRFPFCYTLGFILILPPAMLLIIIVFTADARLKRNEPAAARRKHAFSVFKRHLAKADSLADLDRALRTYFADKLNMQPFAHTVDDLEASLDLPEEHITAVRQLYDSSDIRRYTGKTIEADLNQLRKQALACIVKVDKEI